MHQFPLPLACVPPSFAPAWHEFSDALSDGTTTFLLPSAPALLTSLHTPAAAPALAVVDVVHDVVGSGRLSPAALARLRSAAASGAPWWLVVHNLEGVDSSARAVNGGNLLMMLLERRAGARYEGVELMHSAALLLDAGGGGLRALQGRWEALAAQAQPARGQTPLNTEALFARIAKSTFPPGTAQGGGGSSSEWSAALHSRGCRGARSGAAAAGGASSSSSSGGSVLGAALQAGLAGLALVLLVVLAVAVGHALWGKKAAAAASSSSSTVKAAPRQPAPPVPAAPPAARQRPASRAASPTARPKTS